jgi:hypothetical protein
MVEKAKSAACSSGLDQEALRKLKLKKPLRRRKTRMIAMAPGRAAYVAELIRYIAPLVRRGILVKVRMRPFRPVCGAATRTGHPCRCFALTNGRCRLHGGLSTGPKTDEGWARTRSGYAAWRQAQRAAKAAELEKGD